MSLGTICMGCLSERGGRPCPDCRYMEGTPPASLLQLPPHVLLNNRYELGRVLGQGGFGITYIARDLSGNGKDIEKLAIKEYFPSTCATRTQGRAVTHSDVSARMEFQEGLRKFHREGETLKHFKGHPNVVEYLNSFTDNGTAYIVMKYVDGITLLEYLKRQGGRISFDQTLAIMVHVMDALRAVHTAGILHRDVSPDNIYISRDGVVKILDFGSHRNTISSSARSVQVFLKNGYSPVEQEVSNLKQGPWTDVYALAATFYRCVTGQAPSPAIERLSKDDLMPPSQIGVQIPARSEKALTQALAVLPRNRCQDIADFQQAVTPPKKDRTQTPLQNTGVDRMAASPLTAPSAAGTARLAKAGYQTALAIFGSFTCLFLLQFVTARANDYDAALAAQVTGIATLVTLVLFVHRLWSCVQDSKTEHSANQAVFLSLIPFGSYKSIGKFAGAFNEYAERHGSAAPKLSAGLFIVFSMIWGGMASIWLFWLTSLGVWPDRGWGFIMMIAMVVTGMTVVSRACDGVNALGGAAQPPAGPAARPPRVAGWPCIHCVTGELRGQGVEIRPEGLVIGRNPRHAQLVLTDPAVSNMHARVWCEPPGTGVWLEDQSSLGTWCLQPVANARWTRVSGRVQLAPGGRFRLGECGAIFEVRRQ